VMASMYAVYHGPKGLRRSAERVQLYTRLLAQVVRDLGYTITDGPLFDTFRVSGGPRTGQTLIDEALARRVNLRRYADGSVGVALDETVTVEDLNTLAAIFGAADSIDWETLANQIELGYPEPLQRTSDYLTHPVFNSYHSEHEMLRYIHRLQARDLSLIHSMIPLGSCTM